MYKRTDNKCGYVSHDGMKYIILTAYRAFLIVAKGIASTLQI